MQIVCISGGVTNRTRMLAERLAHKLGCKSLSREDIIEGAIKEGIRIGKLEAATIKPQIFTERLAIEREYYRAFATAYLGGQTTEKGIVYHGRSGHLLFHGIEHVLKVRVVEDEAVKIQDIMQRLGLDHEKAHRYLEDVEEDRRRWARAMYGVSLEDPVYYDFVINLGHMSVENAAAALANIAQLPDFQATPFSKLAVEDLILGANARILLARDNRTSWANVKVRADRGVITVSYLPQDAKLAPIIPEVLAPLEGKRDLLTTMATTNILWIEESYDIASGTFNHVVDIATRWNAAIELLQFMPQEDQDAPAPFQQREQASLSGRSDLERECIGGIEEEGEASCEDGQLRACQETLARLGRSGGGRRVCGGREQIIQSIDRTVPYSLVVVGDVFLAKGHSARVRMVRQLQLYVSDHFKVPVVNAEDLQSQYLFSQHDLLQTIAYLGLVVLIFLLVFTHQESILKFLSGAEWKAKTLASVVVFLFAPAVAYLYGNVTHSLMKLIRME